MKNNRIMWGLVSLVVLITIVVSFGTMSSHSQKDTSKEQNKSRFGDLSKYPVVDFSASESTNVTERQERIIKNKRYDKKLFIAKNPDSGDFAWIVSDAEPAPPIIPYVESRLIIIGEIQNSKAFLSNEKAGIYSEYSVCIDAILKQDKQKKRATGEIITMDRAGGIVRYPNGHQMLYRIDWQDLPEVRGRYLFFLSNDDEENSNFSLLTAYQIKNGKIIALDNHNIFGEFDGMSEADFTKLVLSKKLSGDANEK